MTYSNNSNAASGKIHSPMYYLFGIRSSYMDAFGDQGHVGLSLREQEPLSHAQQYASQMFPVTKSTHICLGSL